MFIVEEIQAIIMVKCIFVVMWKVMLLVQFFAHLSLGFPTAQLIKEFRKAKSSLSMSLPYFGLRLLAGNETNGKMFKTNN